MSMVTGMQIFGLHKITVVDIKNVRIFLKVDFNLLHIYKIFQNKKNNKILLKIRF